MSASSNTTPAVDSSQISQQVTVINLQQPNRDRSEAANYIELGYLVTDQQGFSLMVEARADGTRHLVRGQDSLGWRNEINRHDTIRRARMEGEGGRPSWVGERPLTDYESGKPHPLDCGIANCDHPVHFGGSETGALKFEKINKEGRNDKKDDGASGQGGTTV